MKAANEFRRQLADGWVFCAGCFDALSARLAEHVGFPGAYLSGGSFQITQYGYRGVICTMTELAAQVGRISAAVGVPLLVDADTGFGDVEDVMRTVREIERAGASGLHIEDVAFPITLAGRNGRRILPDADAVGRVKAALAARSDPEFVIVGRTDSYVSFDEIVRRSNLYLEAGADVAFPTMAFAQVGDQLFTELAPEEQMKLYKRLVAEIDGPVLGMMIEGLIPNGLTVSEMRDVGFTWVILPTLAATVARTAMLLALQEALVDGRAASYLDTHPDPIGRGQWMGDWARILGADEVLEHERRFGPFS